ncbi:MAG: response regulator [Ignavibacteriales bacterium]|nr:MAG: response regulator [Ignavibacteriales bacterium]
MQLTERKNILYVEDLIDAYELVEVLLFDVYKVLGAKNKEDAVNMLQSNQIDLILMDINLQRPFDGVELAMQLKEDQLYKNIPIIAVTAYAMEDDKRKIINAGMDDYISKPVTKDQLLRKIANFIN